MSSINSPCFMLTSLHSQEYSPTFQLLMKRVIGSVYHCKLDDRCLTNCNQLDRNCAKGNTSKNKPCEEQFIRSPYQHSPFGGYQLLHEQKLRPSGVMSRLCDQNDLQNCPRMNSMFFVRHRSLTRDKSKLTDKLSSGRKNSEFVRRNSLVDKVSRTQSHWRVVQSTSAMSKEKPCRLVKPSSETLQHSGDKMGHLRPSLRTASTPGGIYSKILEYNDYMITTAYCSQQNNGNSLNCLEEELPQRQIKERCKYLSSRVRRNEERKQHIKMMRSSRQMQANVAKQMIKDQKKVNLPRRNTNTDNNNWSPWQADGQETHISQLEF